MGVLRLHDPAEGQKGRRLMARPRKLWRYSYGQRPDTVQAIEKRMGAPVYLRWTDERGGEAGRTLGLRVRDASGRIDPDAEAEAMRAARERSLELQYGRLRGVTEPARLTVGEAVALFTDPKRGAMPKSASARSMYARLLQRFRGYTGPDKAWARVVPADVRALVREIRDAEGNPTEAWHLVKVIRRLWRWMDEDAGYEGIRNPTKGIKLKKDTVGGGYRPNKPRFTAAEALALIETRHDPRLDKRWALFLALMDDSGRRGVQIRRLMRSDVNRKLSGDVPVEFAPYGWVWYAGTKGQGGVPHFLTQFEHRELQLALSTWLAPLEDRWQQDGRDYPLLPGEVFPPEGVFRPGRVGVDVPVSYETTKKWLRLAEQVAGVPYVPGRGLHGIRRTWVDITRTGMGIEGAQFEGGWSSRETVEGYAEDLKIDVRDAARRLHEKKRER